MNLLLILLATILLPENIKLYYNGAVVEYRTTVKLKKGINELYLTGIRSKNGIRILGIKGEDGVFIGGYSLLDSVPISGSRVKKLKRTQDSLLGLKEILNKRIDIVSKEQVMLTGILNSKRDTIYFDAVQLSALLDTIRRKSLFLKKMELSLRKELKRIMKELDVVNDSLRLYAGPVISLTAVSEKNGASKLIVNVFNTNIYYAPMFTINAEPDKDRAILSAFAKIENRTGLKFKNVSLTVFMQRYEPYALPDIVPEVFYYEEPELSYNFPRYSKRYTGAKSAPENIEKRKFEVEARPYTLGESFYLRGKYVIGEEISVPVFYDTLPANFIRKSYPRIYDGVYLSGTLTAGKYPVYLKNIRVLVDGVYQGYFTYIEKEIVFSRDTFTVNFGKDNMVVVKRKKLKDFSTSSWTGAKIKQFEYLINVQNLRNTPIYDNLPVFTSDKYRLKNVRIEPSDYQLNKETGVIKWSLKLDAKQKKELRLYYEISKR